MKRDMDLVRKILLAVEEHEDGFAPSPLTIDDYTEEQIGFHILVMGEAGLLNVAEVTPYTSNTPQASALWVTWQGYEFLDAAREPSRWEAAKAKFMAGGVGLAFDLLKDLLLRMGREQLGLTEES